VHGIAIEGTDDHDEMGVLSSHPWERNSATCARPSCRDSLLNVSSATCAPSTSGCSASKRNVPNRPELIEAYGWDVKHGSHALRLAHQGFEIASTGSLSLPLPDRERAAFSP